MKLTDKLRNWMDSEDGEKALEEWAKKTIQREEIITSQINRFHTRCLNDKNYLSTILDKILSKYKSDSYKDRHYSRGIQPPESLKYFLLEYSKQYGEECTDDEWERLGNSFTTILKRIDNIYFERMDGQGSVVNIWREEV